MARVVDVLNVIADDVVYYNESENPNHFIRQNQAINTGSIDTSTFDQFRFGVELTTPTKNFGIVKVFSGDGSLRLKQTSFGQSFNYRGSQTYIDRTDNPIQFLMCSPVNVPVLLDAPVFPNLTALEIQSNPNFDGAIDVLNIVIDPSDIDSQKPVPLYAEGVRGEFSCGSPDYRRASANFASVFVNDKRSYIPAYLDGEITTIPNIPRPFGLINTNQSTIAPFEDKKVVREFDTSSYDNTFRDVVSQLNPSIVEPTIQNSVYSTGGFVYDNSIRGIDSIAFGGQTY